LEAELGTDNLSDELKQLRRLLDESNSAHEKAVKRADDLVKTATEDKAEAEHLRDELKSFREDASRFSREDDRKIRHLEREKQMSDKKIARLKSEVAELRSVIQQYVGEIKNGLGNGASSALHTELDLVRRQAETDVKEMREQLKARELNDSAGAAELDVLRQEFDSHQQDGELQREALAEAESDKQRLKEEAEGQRGEVQRLQQALDIARNEVAEVEGRRKDQVEVRKQVEASLENTQTELKRLRQKGSAATGLMGSRQDSGASIATGRNKFIPGLVGALVAFILAEGIAIMSGKGELITGLVDNEAQDAAFEFPLSERRKSVLPAPAGTEKTFGIAKVATGKPNKSPPEKRPHKVGNESAIDSTVRDRLRAGGSGPVMSHIGGGEFNMGQRRDQLATTERPLHLVKLKSFAIGKYEVTFNEYLAFARATGRKMPPDQGWGRGKRPVINVSWVSAVAYARWLTRQTGNHYRLPTEAEWEYAASGGTDSFFWWGYALGENRASCFDCGSQWDGKSTAPVGSFKANPYAINDTAGNVMEWVADCYHGNYQGAPNDGSAWVEKDCSERVARGGAYNKPGDSLHTTRRFRFQQDTKLPMLGFRVAREVKRP